MPPPPRAINLVMKEEFLCVDEGEKVELSVTIGYYGSRKVRNRHSYLNFALLFILNYIFHFKVF